MIENGTDLEQPEQFSSNLDIDEPEQLSSCSNSNTENEEQEDKES